MKISALLDNIDSGFIALPEFQRGYVWNRDQVRGLMEALYRRHPVGSLLVWATEPDRARHRGDAEPAGGIFKLLLDGQQRLTSLYGIVRGAPPAFFDGNPEMLADLRFHLEAEEFSFYSPVKMRDDPLWIDVTGLLRGGMSGLGETINEIQSRSFDSARLADFIGRLTQLVGILDIDLHVEEVTGADKTVEIVVDIFNRVNSGGTKLSKGDLALAKICAEWPEARSEMRKTLARWADAGFDFNLDWLLRNVNTLLTGEAKFVHLHDAEPSVVREGLSRAIRHIDHLLNLIGSRLGLDHDRVLFGRFALPVLVSYLDRRSGQLSARERDRMLFWFVQAAMWGRFSGSTETVIDQDLRAIEEVDGGLDRLVEQLRLWHGGLRVEPGHFAGWSLGARFYPVLYMLTRVGDARDWGDGIALKADLLGRMSKLEIHHIFPRAQLYQSGYRRPEVNAVANFCFLTKSTNLSIGAEAPEIYLPEVEKKYPGALASQWVPPDRELWRVDRYPEFLEARRTLLAEATNGFLAELLHGDDHLLSGTVKLAERDASALPGGIESEEEQQILEGLRSWVTANGLPEGSFLHELVDEDSSEAVAILDLAWPDGLQVGLSQPVALLINEGSELISCANRFGFRCFTEVDAFKRYVHAEILANDREDAA